MGSKEIEKNPERELSELEKAAGDCASKLFMEEVNAAIDSVPEGALKKVNLDDWFREVLSGETKRPARTRRPLPRRALYRRTGATGVSVAVPDAGRDEYARFFPDSWTSFNAITGVEE